MRCPKGCRISVPLRSIKFVRHGNLTKCGAACERATTRHCDCVCGGRNHGRKAGYYVHGDVQRVVDWRSWRARPAEWQGFTINFPELREGLDDDNDPDGGNLGVFGVREHEIRDLQNLYVPAGIIIPTERDKHPEHIERVGAAIIRNRRVDAIIIVRRAVPGSALRLEHGHHRYLALRARGFQTIPASVVWTTAKGSTTVPGLAAGDATLHGDAAKKSGKRERHAALERQIRALNLSGWGGACGEAAISINHRVFGGRGRYVAGVNDFWLKRDHAIGHVAVAYDGVYWDSDGLIPREDLRSWGMLVAADERFAHPDFDDEAADEAVLIELDDEAEVRKLFGQCEVPGHEPDRRRRSPYFNVS